MEAESWKATAPSFEATGVISSHAFQNPDLGPSSPAPRPR